MYQVGRTDDGRVYMAMASASRCRAGQWQPIRSTRYPTIAASSDIDRLYELYGRDGALSQNVFRFFVRRWSASAGTTKRYSS